MGTSPISAPKASREKGTRPRKRRTDHPPLHPSSEGEHSTGCRGLITRSCTLQVRGNTVPPRRTDHLPQTQYQRDTPIRFHTIQQADCTKTDVRHSTNVKTSLPQAS